MIVSYFHPSLPNVSLPCTDCKDEVLRRQTNISRLEVWGMDPLVNPGRRTQGPFCLPSILPNFLSLRVPGRNLVSIDLFLSVVPFCAREFYDPSG